MHVHSALVLPLEASEQFVASKENESKNKLKREHYNMLQVQTRLRREGGLDRNTSDWLAWVVLRETRIMRSLGIN